MKHFAVITPQELVDMIDDDGEFALIDIRDYGLYLQGHLWLASRLPYSSLEIRIARFVPCSQTRLILIDEDQSLVEYAATSLARMGYRHIFALQGGMSHWATAGYAVIEGDYVLAHAFGLHTRNILETPSISAKELRQKLAGGENPMVIDTRDPRDYLHSSLPMSINIPIAELTQEIPRIVAGPDTEIIVHCGGVTRAVIGAQTLIDARIPNPVRWLEDGTSAWALAGGSLQAGKIDNNNRPLAGPDTDTANEFGMSLSTANEAAYVSLPEFDRWRQRYPQRSYYLIDVRSKKNFLAGHYQGAMHVPGGELVGMTIDHIATWRARIFLLGTPHGEDAEITAAWLRRAGWSEVFIVSGWSDDDSLLEKGTERISDISPPDAEMPALGLAELQAMQSGSAISPVIIDFSGSTTYASRHIPGSSWCLRSCLSQAMNKLEAGATIVVVSESDTLSALITREIHDITRRDCLYLSGGLDSWLDYGLNVETGMTASLCERLDIAQTHSDDALESCRMSIRTRNKIFEKFAIDQPCRFDC